MAADAKEATKAESVVIIYRTFPKDLLYNAAISGFIIQHYAELNEVEKNTVMKREQRNCLHDEQMQILKDGGVVRLHKVTKMNVDDERKENRQKRINCAPGASLRLLGFPSQQPLALGRCL